MAAARKLKNACFQKFSQQCNLCILQIGLPTCLNVNFVENNLACNIIHFPNVLEVTIEK